MINIVFEGTDKSGMEDFYEAVCEATFDVEENRDDLRVSRVGEIEGAEGYFNLVLSVFEAGSSDLWIVIDYDKAFKKRDEVLTPELSRGIFSEGSVCC